MHAQVALVDAGVRASESDRTAYIFLPGGLGEACPLQGFIFTAGVRAVHRLSRMPWSVQGRWMSSSRSSPSCSCASWARARSPLTLHATLPHYVGDDSAAPTSHSERGPHAYTLTTHKSCTNARKWSWVFQEAQRASDPLQL